jgi:hypothetical protein
LRLLHIKRLEVKRKEENWRVIERSEFKEKWALTNRKTWTKKRVKKTFDEDLAGLRVVRVDDRFVVWFIVVVSFGIKCRCRDVSIAKSTKHLNYSTNRIIKLIQKNM